ncbi:YycH family regulatory protein [Paenibacillus tarimensis]
MMERLKTGTLVLLVALSLVQSYFLAYSIPTLGTKVASEKDYVQTEKMGSEERVENLIFPEDMVLHFGGDKHTVLYPNTEFFEQIFRKLASREFRGFQRNMLNVHDWAEVRKDDIGVELRFGYGVPVELLMKVFKLEGDLQFLGEKIERIWIFKMNDRDEVRVYFFSSDGRTVYESIRADLTISDVQEYVGFGAYWTPYRTTNGKIYLPEQPIEAVEALIGYQMYTPEQMLRNLFFDPAVLRTNEDRSGTQIYTDSKRGLQVEQDGQWIRYINPVAPTGNTVSFSDNVYTSLSFINQHGGWDGIHRLINPSEQEEGRNIMFQQYYLSLPIISQASFRFGAMKLVMQQGTITEYERSLMTLGSANAERKLRYLPDGDTVAERLANYERRSEVRAVFPALMAGQTEERRIRLLPVWAVRLRDGTVEKIAGALPDGTVVETEQAGQLSTKPSDGQPAGELDREEEETDSDKPGVSAMLQGKPEMIKPEPVL